MASPLDYGVYSPPHPHDDLISYLPKHSRKPSLLSSSRNINMKNLLLNLNSSPKNSHDDDSSTSSYSSVGTASDVLRPPVRRRNLTLAIPDEKVDPPLATPAVTTTPIVPPELVARDSPHSAYRFPNPDSDCFVLPPSTSRDTPGKLKSPFVIDHLAGSMAGISLNQPRSTSNHQTNTTNLSGKTTFKLAPFHSQQIQFNPSAYPVEELQEKSQLDAYPHGPASVLNDTLFLYSDPTASNPKININDYDLVINVAKECEDLLSSFAKVAGKEYIHIPWSHTSSISEELPALTDKIRQFDDLAKPGHRRKILVHCQCGVSRLACVIVAYFMKKFAISVNEAYELLKLGTDHPLDSSAIVRRAGFSVEACDRICPNMSLIFELMEFGEALK